MGKPLDPTVGHRIALKEAAAQAARHRGGGSHRAGDSGAFNAKPVQELLAQPGCVGVRWYLGRDEQGARTMLLVGVDAKGNNMTDGILLDGHFPCPPFCSDPDALQG
jgi:hypothetical protein